MAKNFSGYMHIDEAIQKSFLHLILILLNQPILLLAGLADLPNIR